MKSTQPFIKFAITGGASPSTSIRVELYKNGDVITQIKNAWPVITTNDEVGIYKYAITEAEIQSLITEAHKQKNLNSYYGEKLPGSLKYHLTISDDTNDKIIRWDHFASLPKALENFSESLQQLLKNSLQYNDQTIKISLEISSKNTQNNATIYIHNTGKMPVTIILPEHTILKKRTLLIAHKEENDSAYLNLPAIYSDGIPFQFETTESSFTIATDEKVSFSNTLLLEKNKTWYAMMEVQLKINTTTNTVAHCFLLAKGIQN
ncbi:hypothetical protein IMCC3317_00440 [Kordia antarctica]|uniref:Uncharacterized protein n=1 Tax=Kordia antarctica TaxID=1218801 RepID=A0A7L4ZDW0_9FLAO|nr:hypothetical protein [Kordia antarctica]QHI34701.1 hypothetical protein IMCC3317_00440 [Kordia antarctica]